jgi:hypothetical protein
MAESKEKPAGPSDSDGLSRASSRYNLEREPLHSERSASRFPIPVHRAGWDWARRRQTAAWLAVAFIVLILLMGVVLGFYGDKVWNIMIGRWN